MRAGDTEWAHALAGGLSVCGAKGSFAGLTANVPEAVDNKYIIIEWQKYNLQMFVALICSKTV